MAAAGLTPPGTNPKGSENPDGFYQVARLVEATGATPGQKSIGSTNGPAAVSRHITGTGDFEIVPVGGGPTQVCLVPRRPK